MEQAGGEMEDNEWRDNVQLHKEEVRQCAVSVQAGVGISSDLI